MAEAPADNSPLGSQINPLLRQRMLNRAATFSEGAQPPPVPRRRSSILSQYSDTRPSFRSSTDDPSRTLGNNDMEKLTKTDDISIWHSAPLAFAIVPAFAGVFFQNGGALVTDILLLGFGSLFLNWCVRTPWEWYHAAQQTQYVEYDEPEHAADTILEEDEASGEPIDGDAKAPAPNGSSSGNKDNVDVPATRAQEEARQELRKNEMWALAACFIGPLIGAYLLHAIRSQLTRPAEGLVSNYNLTIFVMGAELRPIHHVIKMKQARMLHLQRIVYSDSKPESRKADIQGISARLADLEARASESPQHTDIETLKIGASVRQGIQPQLDALNRAVRRYEKRQAAQSIQIEGRFQELDSRLRDALALAAAAARTGQRPGAVSMLLTWIANIFAYGMQTAWAVATYPYRTTAAVADRVSNYVTGCSREVGCSSYTCIDTQFT
ncbi:hypothetical protein BU23DRAFT_590493 [Bimuria novae-zelandiae CBS 107.79]|uniref:Uncharacterized protein n=1 Tax=Bimuria novae-zelandiae CBS 107.79 TaxID=1447943 RepID=A0A6A5V4D1_9PLEO|nr:hypothetical protein BU23DRAFT_590493 [Bimuria novae-zelandiae CBS 107.79]